MVYSTAILSLSFLVGAALADFNSDCNLTCPDKWGENACNSNSPNFCCPGSISVSRSGSSCCVGGFFVNDSCSGGTLVTVGSDLAAYSSSASAALASISGTGSSNAATTGVSLSSVPAPRITFDPIVIGGSTVVAPTVIGGTSATTAPSSGGAAGVSSSPSTGAAMPARTAGAQLAGIIAGAGLLLI